MAWAKSCRVMRPGRSEHCILAWQIGKSVREKDWTERMPLERLVGPHIKGCAHSKNFFLRKMGGSVGGRLVWMVTGEAERPGKR